MNSKGIMIIILIVSASTVMSCRARMTPSERRAYRMEKQMKKENEKLVEDYLRHHYNIQPDETQAMMKNSRKRAKKVNRMRHKSFIDRIFGNNRSKGCDGN